MRLFPHNEQHIVWLEPEDRDLSVVYPGGLSGAFAAAVQQQLLHSIEGLEAAVMLRPAYDVEYQIIRGRQLKPSLEAKHIQGLFFAGQVLGTTGAYHHPGAASAAAAAAAAAGAAA